MVEDFYNRSLGLNLSRADEIQISVIGYMTRTFERLLHYICELHDHFKCSEDLNDILPIVEAYNNDLMSVLKWRSGCADHPDRVILYLFCRNVEYYSDNFVSPYNKSIKAYGDYDKIETATDKLFEAGKYASMIIMSSNVERCATKHIDFYVTSFINRLFDGVLDKCTSKDDMLPELGDTAENVIAFLTTSIVQDACRVSGKEFRD